MDGEESMVRLDLWSSWTGFHRTWNSEGIMVNLW